MIGREPWIVVDADGQELCVTACLSCATLPPGARTSAEELFERADSLLQPAKAGGRNRVAWTGHRAADTEDCR